MRKRLFKGVGLAAMTVAGFVLTQSVSVPVEAQGTAVPKTAWGEADLQGIWTDNYNTPLQRPSQFKDKATFTDEERAAFDKQRGNLLGRDNLTLAKGTERDVAGAYNAVFTSVKHTGKRTSMI